MCEYKSSSFLCCLTVLHDFQAVKIKTLASIINLNTVMSQFPKYYVLWNFEICFIMLPALRINDSSVLFHPSSEPKMRHK